MAAILKPKQSIPRRKRTTRKDTKAYIFKEYETIGTLERPMQNIHEYLRNIIAMVEVIANL